MNKENKYFQLISALISIILAIIFGVVINKYAELNIAVPFSIIVGLLSNVVLLLNFKILNRLPNIEDIQKKIDRQNSANEKIIKQLKDEENKIRDIFIHLSSKKILFKEFGSSLINDYLSGFVLTKKGVVLRGEYWALKTYLKFWEFLCQEQRKRFEDNNLKGMIARVTHSNDINIWHEGNSPYKQFSVSLYLVQKEFIDLGGIIVRMLIGPHKEPDDAYKKVIQKMEEIGIEVKYFSVSEVEESDADFLSLEDEEIALKWHSGQQGKRLASCEVENYVDPAIKRTWDYLYYRADDKGNRVMKIPHKREVRIIKNRRKK